MPPEKPPKPGTIEKPIAPVDVEQKIEEIKVLKQQFEAAFVEGRTTKDLSRAKELKAEIEAKFAEY